MNKKLTTFAVGAIAVLGITNLVTLNENIKLKSKLASSREARQFVTRQFDHALDLIPTTALLPLAEKIQQDFEFHKIVKNF